MSNNFKKISIRGGYSLNDFLKYFFLPLMLAIAPVIFVNFWVAGRRLSEGFLFFILFLAPFLGVGILIEIYSFFNFRLILENNGTLFVKGRIFVKKQGRLGSKLVNTSVNVNNATFAKIEPEIGLPFRLYENDKVISEWNTEPISKKNMQRFLKGLQEINPAIKFDKYCEELLQTGGAKKLNTKFLKIGLPLFLGLGAMFYLPTLELLINKIIVKQFSWYQKSLQDWFYLSLVPFSGTILILFLIRNAKFWKSTGMQSILRFVFAVTFFLPIIAGVLHNPSLLLNIKFLGGTIVAAVFIIFVFFSFPREKIEKLIKVAIALIFLGIALSLHIMNYLDFFTEPLVLRNEIATIKSIRSKEEGMLEIALMLQNNEVWNIAVPKELLPQIQEELRERPINLYYTKYLKTPLKIEDSISGDIIYQR